MHSNPQSSRISIFSIGHSTHSASTLIRILQAFHITTLVDVRTIPKSHYNPEFNQDTFAVTLSNQGIKYCHYKALGGLRHPLKNSLNLGWRNRSFRGYADYMQTPDFSAALQALIELSKHEHVAIMCAEILPWRCHRSLIADALLLRGITMQHIFSINKSECHKMTPFAQVNGLQIIYPTPEAK